MPSQQYEIGNSQMHIMESSHKNQRKGCWVGVAGAIGIVFLAALVAMAVGLLVFYLHPHKSEGNDVTEPQVTPTVIPITTSAPPVDYRLSLDLIPTHYIAKLRPYFYDGPTEDFHVNGSVRILFDVQRTTRELVLHKKLMDIDVETISVKHSEGTEVVVSGAPSYDVNTELYRIPLAGDLAAGNTYSVYMEFVNPLKDDLKGIYLSEYTDDEGKKKFIATSHTQPTEARKVFPCFDEPALKANFTVTLERKSHMKSFCNAGIKMETVLSDGWIADEYATTPPMSTYILAFMVSEFQCLNTTTNRGKQVYVCCRPEYLFQAEHAISIAGEMQEFYEDYHDVDYPLPITVHMAVPDFSAGAMENWGLIFYRETALLFDEMSSAAYNKQRVTIVVAHELAHMWFGNLVTPAWWDDIWLNEGFASYMEILCTNSSFPEWDMDGQLVSDDLQSVLTVDGLVSSHPIYQPVYDTAQINELFDSIAYSKGASIIRMMRFFLGDETFKWGISNYLKDRAYQAAHHNDLFTALTEQAELDGLTDVNVTEIMQTWILQLGYPVVNVSYDSASGDVTVTQKHFLIDPSQDPPESPFGYQWIVPISLVPEGGDFNNPTQGWLRSNSETISTSIINKNWMIGNARQQFYYRVNYDQSMWQAIITQLTDDHLAIHSNNRAELIDDSFNLGRSGDLDIEVSLDVTRYLVNEQEYVPWRTTWHNLDYMNRMLQTSGNYGYLQKYVQQLIKPTYDRIGWNDDTLNDPHLEQRHRVITLDLACGYGMAECLARAGEEFHAWMNESMPNTTNPISNNLRSVTYCSAVKNGGAREWEFAWEMYQSAPSSSERGTLLGALTCTQEVYLLSALLDRTLRSDGVRRQDFSSVVSNVASNPVGRALAWNFIRQNWEQLVLWFGEIVFTLPRIVDGTTTSFSSPWELYELESFRENTADLATAVRSFDQAIENTKSNIDWRDKNENKIVEWIKTQI